MLFRSLVLLSALCAFTASFAQRPTATIIGDSLVRLDLDGFHVFADAPLSGSKAIGVDDIALYVIDPPGSPAGGFAFTPAMTGALLDHRTERLGDKTGIYVSPRHTTFGEVPHCSYLVQWNGRRVWFSGNTDDPSELLQTSDIDVAFVPPIMLDAVSRQGRTIDARTVVLYHINDSFDDSGLNVPCKGCKVVVPKTGDVLQLFR